jgi:hypothetical protein
MKTKIFKLSSEKHGYKVNLKIDITKNNIETSWLHNPVIKTVFTNNRKFDISELKFAFETLKPTCNKIEIIEIENFMFEKSEGEQFSLF